MFPFIFKRILFAIPVFIAVTFITFSMIHIVPGGPFDSEKEMPPEIRQALEHKYGLDRPLMVQYAHYMKNLCKGDLGPSLKYSNWDVSDMIQPKIKVSFELGVYSFAFALVVGILIGVLCAYFRERWIDHFLNFLATLGICLPAFVVGPLLVYFFAIKFRLFSVACWSSWQDKVLPSITVGILYASYIARLARSGICEVMQKQYIVAAKARGLSERRIFFIHGLKNGLVPVVAYLGPAFAGIISGAIVTETVFQIPGLGRLFIQAIASRDDTLLLGIVNFYALAIIVCSTVTDCLQLILNPRSRID